MKSVYPFASEIWFIDYKRKMHTFIAEAIRNKRQFSQVRF